MFGWKILGPGIHGYVTLTCTTYLNKPSTRLHGTAYTHQPIFHQDNATLSKLLSNDLRIKTKSSRCWHDLQIPQILIWPSTICGMCWSYSTQTSPIHGSPISQDLMDLLLTFLCQIPQYIFRGLALMDLHNIRQMFWMLWLIGTCLVTHCIWCVDIF